MDTQERRQAILKILKSRHDPITANELAHQFQVSRQVIVGDIAILRASDHDILATNAGYLMNIPQMAIEPTYYTGKIVCQHGADQAQEELTIIVSSGGQIHDVQVDHPFYGLIAASLKIATPQDIQDFLDRMADFQGEMLSSLTNGIHIHTITTPTVLEFQAIQAALDEVGILYSK